MFSKTVHHARALVDSVVLKKKTNGCERKQSCLNRNTIPKSERKCHGEPYEKLQLGQPFVRSRSEPITSYIRSKNTIHYSTGVNDVKQTNAILSSMSRQYRLNVSTGKYFVPWICMIGIFYHCILQTSVSKSDYMPTKVCWVREKCKMSIFKQKDLQWGEVYVDQFQRGG
jgi:hypothetical protein